MIPRHSRRGLQPPARDILPRPTPPVNDLVWRLLLPSRVGWPGRERSPAMASPAAVAAGRSRTRRSGTRGNGSSRPCRPTRVALRAFLLVDEPDSSSLETLHAERSLTDSQHEPGESFPFSCRAAAADGNVPVRAASRAALPENDHEPVHRLADVRRG